MRDVTDADSVIETITSMTYQELKNSGVIVAGMLPKLDNCFYALQNKVAKVCIGTPEMLFTTETKHTTLQK